MTALVFKEANHLYKVFHLFVFNTLLSEELEEENKQDSDKTVFNTNYLRAPLWGKGYDIYQKASLTGIEALLHVCLCTQMETSKTSEMTKKSHLYVKLRAFISEHEVRLREE